MMRKPILFYPLDDVSETRNIGELALMNYSAVWMSGKGYFNCSWTNNRNSNGRKLLQLIPSDDPWLSVFHDLRSNLTNQFTMSVWFKKRDPHKFQMPLLETFFST
jgi:hypothetical protein